MCLLRMRQAALTMIDAARARGIEVVVAGSDASDHPELYLDRGARAIVTGEGEATLVELLDAVTGRVDGAALTAIRGLAVRDGHRTIRTAPREFIRDLDELPRPAWDLVDIERYRTLWLRRHGYFSMNIVTTRGCPFHCNWCAKPIYGQRYTVRSPEKVVDEIAWLKASCRPDHLWMADDIFGLKPGWIAEFARLANERAAVVPFKCLLRADGVSPEIATLLRTAGCRTAWMGAESGSQRILDAMEKGTQVSQIASATRLLHDAGIEVGFFLQFGYPGETLEDIGRTLQMVRDCRPDDIGVSVSYPLPGTLFYERVRSQLGDKQNWVDSNDLAMMYRATYVPEFYRALHALVHAEFRSRPSARAGSLRQRVAGVYHGARLPSLRRRVARLARQPQPKEPTVIRPLLSPQAAAVPTEQR
jgi:radical SAM superfamily enzyme YgiQ (UPF0313 family)